MNFWINLGHQLIRKIDDTGVQTILMVVVGTEPENWPPSSPDLNPVDYSILENLSQRVDKHLRIRDMQHLKDLLEEKWEELPQYEIDACIN